MAKSPKERRHPALRSGITSQALAVMPELAPLVKLPYEEQKFLADYLIMGDLNKALEKNGRDATWYEMKKANYPDFANALGVLGKKAKNDGEGMMEVMVPWSVGELHGLIAQDENLGVKMAAIKYLHEAVGVGSQYKQGMPGQGNFLNISVKVATGEKESKVIELGGRDA